MKNSPPKRWRVVFIFLAVLSAAQPTWAQRAKDTSTGFHLCLPAPSGCPKCTDRFKGKYVLVNFWQTSCPDCRKETHLLEELAATHSNLVIYRVSVDGDRAEWKQAVESEKWPDNFVNVWCPIKDRMKIIPKYRVYEVPYSILISPEGRVVKKGELKRSDIQKVLH